MPEERTSAVTLRGSNTYLPDRSEWEQMNDLAKVYVASGLFRGLTDVNVALAKMVKAVEMGETFSFALERIHAIPSQQGVTLTIDGKGMLMRIRRSGEVKYSLEEGTREDVGKYVICTMMRDGDEEPFRVEYNLMLANNAGLMSKDNWKKYTDNMLRWRAIKYCADLCCPDITDGMMLADEMGAETDEDNIPVEVGSVVVEAVEPKQIEPKSDPDDIDFPSSRPENPEPPHNEAPGTVTERPTLELTSPSPAPAAQPEQAPAPVAEPAPAETPPGENGDKQMSAQFNKMWGMKMTSFGVSLGAKVDSALSKELLIRWLANIKSINIADGIGEDGELHISQFGQDKISGLMANLKSPGILPVLKRFVEDIKSKQGNQAAPPATTEPEKQPESAPVEAEKAPEVQGGEAETDKLIAEVQDIQKQFEEQYELRGITLHVTILKKNGLGAGQDTTFEKLQAAKADLIEAYKKVSMGNTIEQVTKEYSVEQS